MLSTLLLSISLQPHSSLTPASLLASHTGFHRVGRTWEQGYLMTLNMTQLR